MAETDIHVAIVEDDPEIRQLFVLLLENSPGFRCAFHFENGEAALAHLSEAAIDIVLMDIDLPGMSGIECTRSLRALQPDLLVIMLTVHEDDEALFDSLCAGATGYILKETAPTHILTHIQTAYQGGAPMSSAIAKKVIHTFHAKPSENPLSGREKEVLTYLCQGQNYKAIAETLFVSPNTIKAHIKSIYRKLEVNTRAEAVSKAHQQRLIP